MDRAGKEIYREQDTLVFFAGFRWPNNQWTSSKRCHRLAIPWAIKGAFMSRICCFAALLFLGACSGGGTTSYDIGPGGSDPDLSDI
jgi:hypothetical protein